MKHHGFAAAAALVAALACLPSDGSAAAHAAPAPFRPESSPFLGVLDSLHASILTIVAIPAGQRTAPPGTPRKRLIGTGVATNDREIVTTAGLAFPDGIVHVMLGGGVQRRATLRGVDRQSNLALFRIDEPVLHSLRRSAPQSLALGSWVAVISNITVNRPQAAIGQVVGRGERVDFPYSGDVIEIDAPGYPASAGGAVLNEDGEWVALVVGRGFQNAEPGARVGNTAPPLNNPGVLLAVPVDQVDRIVGDLSEHGTVQRGFLGIRLKRGPAAPGDTLGVRVDDVIGGSPAALAGIRVGDHILAMDGQEVRTPEDLVGMVATMHPGYDTEVTVLRGTEIMPVKVEIGSNVNGPRQPRQPREAEAGPAQPPTDKARDDLSRLKEQQKALEDRIRALEDSTRGR
jgi:S1-C subfamily serine protease